MVKNLLILRFGNEFFGATWNRNHIDNVQVCAGYPPGCPPKLTPSVRLPLKSRSEQKDAAVTLMTLASFAMLCRIVSDSLHVIFMASANGSVDLLQVLTIIGMERPISFSAEDIRDEKVREYWPPRESR